MADAKKSSFSFLNSLLAFGVIIGLCLWLWMIFSAQGEERLDQACKPVEYSTQFLHEITTAIIGRQPTWTLYTQRYLMSGCYYTFSVIMSESTKVDGASSSNVFATSPDDGTATGGIKP